MSLRESNKQLVCDTGECEERILSTSLRESIGQVIGDCGENQEMPSSAIEDKNDDNPSHEYKHQFYLDGLGKYEKFLRKGYFDIYHKEIEFQLWKQESLYDTELQPNSTALKNYESYKKFLISEHNKIIATALAEETDIRKNMLETCAGMKWSSVMKILNRRQKIVMKRKQALFDQELTYISERNKIMYRYKYYKESDGLALFLKENKLSDQLTGQSLINNSKVSI